MKGEQLEGIRFRHPLYERDSPGVLGDYVTLEAGTGAVHTAPGHGARRLPDRLRYGLEVYAPVGPSGHFLETVNCSGGSGVFDPTRRSRRRSRNAALWHREAFSHQYPHCWRCHNR
jgi:isoleucyl-tRNA synthetase